MDLLNNSSININEKKYKCKLFDTNELIHLIRNNKTFIESLEKTIKIYRNNKDFEIFNLIKEYIYYRPDYITTYFIIHKKNTIIFMCRFYYNMKKESSYFNMVYTNPEYRGQKICQTSIKYLINLSKKYIKKYELEVDVNNIPALKCYENVGFKKIKENNLKGKKYYLMRLKIDKN